MNTALMQYTALSRRALVNMARQPASIIPTLFFPLMFLAMSSAALNRSIDLPGFPAVDSFLQFVVATTIVQGALFGAVAAGSDMAADIEGGFFERLLASPVARTSILVGRVMGAAALGAAQALLYIGVTSLFGLKVAAGFLGILAIASVAAVIAAGIGSLSVAFALRTGSAEAVQGSFPMFFALLFASSAFFPRDLMTGWFKTVATVNPLSHLIEGLRWLVTVDFDVGRYLTALGIAGGILVLGVGIAAAALRSRLATGS